MPQRIVITNFLGGLAPSRYLGNVQAGQMDPGDGSEEMSGGWDVYKNNSNINVLTRGFTTRTITNVSLINGKITEFKMYSRSAGNYLYAIGEDDNLTTNYLYQINPATATITNASPWPHALPTYTGTGMEFYGGYLYYASTRYLGRWNMSLTFDNSFYNFLGTTALGTTIDHPMVQGNGKLFIGNSNFSLSTPCIATVSGETVDPAALDLSAVDQVIKDLEFHDKFLYIAASVNAGGGSYKAPSYMYVWDTVSGSWQEQFVFPEEDIKALKVNNGRIYVFGNRGLYEFTGNNFNLIQPYSGGPSFGGPSVDPRGIMMWPDGVDHIYAYGSPNPQLPSIVYKPYLMPSNGDGAATYWANRTNFYVSDATNTTLILFSSTGTGDYATATWATPMINFPVKARFARIYMTFFSWPSNCTVSVQWANAEGASPTTIGTISTAGETEADFSYSGLVDDSWQIRLVHSTGTSGAAPRFRKIVIEWEPELD